MTNDVLSAFTLYAELFFTTFLFNMVFFDSGSIRPDLSMFFCFTFWGCSSLISGVFGLPGSGKSMFLAAAADSAIHHKKFVVGGNILHYGDYDSILTNFPFDGCGQFNFDFLGKYAYERTLFLIDEMMMYADSRNFKSFSDDLKFFFSQHRKMHCEIIWSSQSYDDTDKKIRGLTDKYFYCRRSALASFSFVSPINSYLRVEDGAIKSGYELGHPIMTKILYLPKYWKMVDSYQIIGHKEMEKAKIEMW